jgi:hypothetical protein
MKGALGSWFVLMPALWVHAVCAGNKFEIIGGGVSGSGDAKLAFMEAALYGAAAVSFLIAVLAAVVPRRNALFLNYANWRQSAAFAVVLGVVFLISAIALQ